MLVFVCLRMEIYMGQNIFIGVLCFLAVAAGIWCWRVDSAKKTSEAGKNKEDKSGEINNEKN